MARATLTRARTALWQNQDRRPFRFVSRIFVKYTGRVLAARCDDEEVFARGCSSMCYVRGRRTVSNGH
eukprot:2480530-Prymnesium_polylepis.1